MSLRSFLRRPFADGLISATLVGVVLIAGLVAGSPAEALEARTPLSPEPLTYVAGRDYRLVVKFRDELRARARIDGGIESRTGLDLSPVEDTVRSFGAGFAPLLDLPETELSDLEARAARRSGRAQPDLAGMLIVDAATADPQVLATIGRALQERPEVEWASLEALGVPPPLDLPPTTPDLSANQGYRFGNPGANSDYAVGWGVTGQGIRLSDCEYAWNPDHEDLNEIIITPEPGQTPHPQAEALYDEHGSAVIGVIASMPNAYGCTGMAPDVELHTFPEWTVEGGFRPVACITSAVAGSLAGDVVLLEIQITGAGGGFGPAELSLPVWTITRTATDAGIVVVGVAGNGNQDLDSPPYEPYLDRGDSGAILVGAGSASILHTKRPNSTYGSRVNVQAWGESVDTIGYGDVAYNGDDELQFYTTSFGGTSAASSIVASACALLQAYVTETWGQPLLPEQVRQLLIDTGWPQGGTGGHIGPAVNIEKALNTLLESVGAPEQLAGAALGGLHGGFPNPFLDATSIRFGLVRGGHVDVSIHDVAGRLVRTVTGGRELPAGHHSVVWDGRDEAGRQTPSGVYFYQVRVDGGKATGRLTRLR